jgi:hypothetical protein
MSNGAGLKQQWGVGDPAKAGSDKQSQQFQAAFQGEMAAINGHLQYTSANADAAHHGPLEARRDALYSWFQLALAQIDRTNPGKAQPAIDKVLADGKALCAETAALHMSAEKALNDWKCRQQNYDIAVHHVEELEAWGHDKAPVLRGLVDGIRTQTNQRTYAQASSLLDQLLPKLKLIYDDYLKQKAAKPKYEQILAEQSARLDALKMAERPSQPMTAKAGEADTALGQARAKADAKDFAGGLEQLKVLRTAIDALDKLAKDPQRAKFLADRKAIEDGLNAPHDTSFKTLEPDWNALLQLRDQSDPAADSGDYAGANKMLADLRVKHAAFDKKLATLKKQKQPYDTALAALQPQLEEALKSAYKPLQPRLDEIANVNGEMEAAANNDDYVAALKSLKDLKAKVEAFLPDLKKVQQAEKDYTKERAAFEPKLDDALVTARQFTALEAARDAIVRKNIYLEAAVRVQEFETALEVLKALETLVDAYLKDAKTEEAKSQKKGDEILKKVDAAGLQRYVVLREEVNKLTPDELQNLPTPVRNRLLQELQEGKINDNDKAAMKKLYSVKTLDPEFEKIDDANRKKMIEKMKTDPAFKTAREHWDTLSEKERVAIMQKAADYQADAYGIPKTTIETYDKDDPHNYGYYNHGDGKLHVNTNDAALKDGGFDEAIDTAVHENGHRYQATLIDKLNAGEIKEGDPLYNEAMTFKLNDGYFVHPPGDEPSPDKGDEYFTQPRENHSRRTGSDVQRAGLGK